MSKLPLIKGVIDYIKEDNISFSMPGHKKGMGFFATREGRVLIDNFIKCDITEVDGVDNLHNAEGIIKESSELLSKLYSSKKSYFLVNGSTSGNLIMIFSSFKEGDKIIVDRNCHKSIFNGIITRKLNPIYVNNSIDKRFNLPLSVDVNNLMDVINKNKDAKGIIITYPNYYGICCDLDTIIKKAQKYHMKVLVDCAHGAHFGINDKLPKSAVKLGADMVVVSAHKTLPSLTQTAFLHVNNKELIDKVDFYFSVFSSTSPSYLFMCSMDYARYYLQEYGNKTYENLIYTALEYKYKINNINHLHILDEKDIGYGYKLDNTRYIINLEKGYNANLLLKYLRQNKIQCEMSDTYNLVLILSPFDKGSDFEYLYKVLKQCDFSNLKDRYINILNCNVPKMELKPYEVLYKSKKEVAIDESLNYISARNITPYPPGIPIIMMGERIDKNVINAIKYYLKNGIDVIGVNGGKISIL